VVRLRISEANHSQFVSDFEFRIPAYFAGGVFAGGASCSFS
ncbi:MAG: hypothetical protein JWO38_770, partial [Gemmataceae bacterium]|nr:hypothetical protein [Gemmataceae bacterium]